MLILYSFTFQQTNILTQSSRNLVYLFPQSSTVSITQKQLYQTKSMSSENFFIIWDLVGQLKNVVLQPAAKQSIVMGAFIPLDHFRIYNKPLLEEAAQQLTITSRSDLKGYLPRRSIQDRQGMDIGCKSTNSEIQITCPQILYYVSDSSSPWSFVAEFDDYW